MALGWAMVSTGRHAETFAAKHGAQVAYASLEALLEDSRVDVVLSASPNFLHVPHTQMAAQRGKHVLVEKPIAVQVDEAGAMVRTCHARGVKLGAGFHLQHHPGHQEARRLGDHGHGGPLRRCAQLPAASGRGGGGDA
jgi:predicted dehydrogenase